MITTMMRDANRVSEVKYKNFVEQCVRHLEKKEMCQVLGNAGKLFLHENLWDRRSRGLSFVKKKAESVGMHKTKSELCRSVDNVFSEDRILFQVEIRVRHWGVGHVLPQQREADRDSCEERHDDGAQRSKERE